MPPVQIERFKETDAAEWDEFVPRTNNGTIFHTRRFLSYHPQGRFVDHSLWFDVEGRRFAVLPAVELNVDGRRLLVSHRGASYGSIVYRNPLGIRDAFDYVAALLKYAKADGFTGIDLTPPPRCYVSKPTDYIEFALLQNGFTYRKREISSVITLDFNPEAVLGTFSESSRRAVRKAIKSGVKIQESDDFAAFYRILERNLRLRHNVKPTHTLDELFRLRELFPDKIRLFAADYRGQMIAGVVLFECNPQAVLAFYISHDNDFQQVRAVNLLFHEIVAWSVREQYKFFDFGIFTVNEDPNWGLGRFKESFGAQGIFRDSLQLLW